MADNKINVGGRLHSIATGNVLAGADEILDDSKGKKQSEINIDVDNALVDRYTKAETYNKNELNSLITTPNVQYITAVATEQTTVVTDILPLVGAANTIYRVGKWNGTQYNNAVHSEYAWDGNAYVLLDVKEYGMDDKPTAGSDNLVTSDGVHKELYIEKEINLSLGNNYISEKYIGSNGNLQNGGALFSVYYFLCRKGDKFNIKASISSSVARLYAIYNTSDIQSVGSSSLLAVGPVCNTTEDETVEVTHEAAQLILIQYYSRGTLSVSKTEYINNFSILSNSVLDTNSRISYLNKYAYRFDGDNLFVAYNEGAGVEITYWFKKCLANDLFSFYRVGYRNSEQRVPTIENIENDNSIVLFYAALSDSIGPYNINGIFVGGNHNYPSNSANPKYKTAKTDSVKILVDNEEISDATAGYCDNISVVVTNSIYDPAFEPTVGDEYLPVKLATEIVLYKISKNTIEVSQRSDFVDSTTSSLAIFYGMQSAFANEDFYITPNGKMSDWTATTINDKFTKGEYPKFNRFVEKSTNNSTYQSTYLSPELAGDHRYIGDNNNIFSRADEKCYHCIEVSSEFRTIAGKSIEWYGCYTFFKNAIVDDNGLLIYRGVIHGEDALFISVSSAKTGVIINIPDDLIFTKTRVIENTGFSDEYGGNSFVIGAKGLVVSANKAASLIITFRNDSTLTTNSMFANKDWQISSVTEYDGNEIPIKYNIIWSDGTVGTVVLSNFNDNVLEYQTITATYLSKVITYNISYDDNGYITNENYNIN